MYKTIRDRLYNILNDLAAVSGTVKTVAPRVPMARQDFEGYVFMVLPGTVTTTPAGDGIRNLNESQIWTIRILAPEVGIGIQAEQESAIMDYADAVLDDLQSRPRLTYNNATLDNVRGVRIQRVTFRSPSVYAQPVSRYECDIELLIEAMRYC